MPRTRDIRSVAPARVNDTHGCSHDRSPDPALDDRGLAVTDSLTAPGLSGCGGGGEDTAVVATTATRRGTVEEDGGYPFVSHDFHDSAEGAFGLFTTNGEGT